MTAIQRRTLIKNEIMSERVSYKKKVNIFDIVFVVNGKGTKHKKHWCVVAIEVSWEAVNHKFQRH